jgi:hypothetical protein
VALWDARKNATDSQRKAFATLIFSFAVVFFTAAQLLGSQFIQDYLNQSYCWMLIGTALSSSSSTWKWMSQTKARRVEVGPHVALPPGGHSR